MAPRKPTGQAVHRRGRWVARVLLHRLPRSASGKLPTVQVDVVRDGAPLTGRTKADRAHAVRFAERLQGRYDDGSWTPDAARAAAPPAAPEAPAAAVTVGAWVARWCAAQDYSEATRDGARVAAYLPRTALHILPLSEVTPRVVAAWVTELRALTSPRTGETAAPRTVRNVYDVVRRALRAAVFDGLLVADPFAALPSSSRPRAQDSDPSARQGYRLTREEVEALVASAEGRWRALWCLLALTGARLGEALALRWRDLVDDAPLRRVVLARQVHHRTRVYCATKTRETRVVPEHPELRRVLEVWRSEGWPEAYGREPAEEDLVVPGRSEGGRPWGAAEDAGGPLWAQDVDRAFKRQLAALGMRPHRVHDLRHTFASLCADAGMRENVAARWTHTPGGSSARHLYALPSWVVQCAEMKLLAVNFEPPPVVGARVATGG
jgi:integrase